MKNHTHRWCGSKLWSGIVILFVACLAPAHQFTLDDVLSGNGVNVSNWRERLGGYFDVTIVANHVDPNRLEYYGLGVFVYNRDAGHYGDHTRNIWSREDYATGAMEVGEHREMHIPQHWRDFGFGILLANLHQGVSIGLSPDPGSFSVYQGTGGLLAVNGEDYRWDSRAYLVAIHTPGWAGDGYDNLV